MRSLRNSRAGFTAIELLITLFVAAGFLVAAYQLFNVIIKDSGQARAESRAGNVAYDYLRRYTSSATDPCVAQTPMNNATVSIDSLSDVKVTVTITCPEYSTTSLSKIDVTLTYNNPQQTVKYSTLVNGSGTQVVDVTDGLIGWWKLNGNANTSVGTANGTVFNAPTTTGQNGINDNAFIFNGTTTRYIKIDSTLGITTGNFSVSLWINNPTASNSGAFIKIGNVNGSGNGYGYGLGIGNLYFDNSNPGTKLVALYESVRWISTTKDVGTGWHHIVLTVDSSGIPTLYHDGTIVGTYGGTAPTTPAGNVTVIGGNLTTTARAFNGSIDDVRIYSRVLSESEISTIYSGGAK